MIFYCFALLSVKCASLVIVWWAQSQHKVLFVSGQQKNRILHLSLKITLAKITVHFDCGSGTSWWHLLPKLPRVKSASLGTGGHSQEQQQGRAWGDGGCPVPGGARAAQDRGRSRGAAERDSTGRNAAWPRAWETRGHRARAAEPHCLCPRPLPTPTPDPGAAATTAAAPPKMPHFRSTAPGGLTVTSSDWTAHSKKSQENVVFLLDVYVRFLFQYKVFIFAPDSFWS